MTPAAAVSTGLQFQNVEKRFGKLYALRRLTLAIADGECVAITGRNGSGKTTALRVAAKLSRPTHGAIQYNGDSPRIGFVAHATMVYDELTAEENLSLFAKLLFVPEPRRIVAQLLEEVGLADRRTSLVRTFSRGMRQRMAIARALLNDPGLLLLDEPSTGLDPQGIRWLAATLRQLHESGRTIVMSVHGESEIASLATRGVRLDAGSVAADTAAGARFESVIALADI